MKTLKPFITLAIIVTISSMSEILYVNQNYISSALLTMISVVAITHWISKRVLIPEKMR
ncbi:MAG TPA: hypothetical protein VNV85_11955 [Puia sp.]|nr:hypothetical protein [Puia sp.]